MKQVTIHKILISTLLLFILYSCKDGKSIDEEWKTLKTSEIHWDYELFIVNNPNFEKFDSAIVLYHKYYNEYRKDIGYPCWDCFGNCYRFEIDNNNSIESQYGNVHENQVYDTVSYFLRHKIVKKRFLPRDSIEITPKIFKMVPNKFLTIFYEESQTYETLQNVLIKSRIAVDEYRDYTSLEWYGTPYEKLNLPSKEIVDSVFKYTIHLDAPFRLK